ncbi:MAG: hypothetical protein Q4D11_01945 [Rhodospirillales bacterium]|nr:hypothetical protein [Rhodospirillales bacterium]
MKTLSVTMLALFLFTGVANAQFAASKDAQYLAVVKAVANYKIDDEENLRQVEELRNNEKFNNKLQKMLDKLSNKRTKDSTNQRVLQILKRTGKELNDLLD